MFGIFGVGVPNVKIKFKRYHGGITCVFSILPVCNRIQERKSFYIYRNNFRTMSSKYKVGEDAIAHFVTFAVVGWVDACLPVGKCLAVKS